MKQILQKLYNHEILNKQVCHNIMLDIADAKYTDEEIAAFLSVYNMRQIRADELAGFRDALLELCLSPKLATHDVIDIVGTGGDGKDTFNISTLSAIVVAGAGYKVAKHGNYGMSSICGSSNVLEHLGYKFSNDSDKLNSDLDKYNLCFLHAPLFHPAMKSVATTRKAMKVRTIFNILGPLVNPARPNYQLLGVSNKKTARLYYDLKRKDGNDFTIVYSMDGYDEISLTGDYLQGDRSGLKVNGPQYFGFDQLTPESIVGGDSIKSSAEIFINILKGRGTSAQNHAVLANSATAIKTINPDLEIEDCIAECKESLMSISAFNNFKSILK